MVCLKCGKRSFSDYCMQHKPRKPLAQVGKQGKRTANAVAKWKRSQKPNHNGTYTCYICNKQVTYLMAEHVKSKVRHPELRTDTENLKPVCSFCNFLKGSNDN